MDDVKAGGSVTRSEKQQVREVPRLLSELGERVEVLEKAWSNLTGRLVGLLPQEKEQGEAPPQLPEYSCEIGGNILKITDRINGVARQMEEIGGDIRI